MLDEHIIESQSQGKKDSPYELRMAIPFPVAILAGKTQTENDPGEELIEFQEDGAEIRTFDTFADITVFKIVT